MKSTKHERGTSEREPTGKPADGSPRAELQLNECRYLANEATDAKAAVIRTLSEIKGTLLSFADLPAWAGQHPWAATGGAAATGLVVGAILSRSAARRAAPDSAAPDDLQADPPATEPPRQPPRPAGSQAIAIAGTLVAGLMPQLLQNWFPMKIIPDGEPGKDPPPPSLPRRAVVSSRMKVEGRTSALRPGLDPFTAHEGGLPL